MNRSILTAAHLSVALLFLILAGCNKSTSAVETAKSDDQTQSEATEGQATLAAEGTAEDAKEQELANVVKKQGTVQNRGGYVKILVNKSPVTNFDIKRRIKFLNLRRAKGNRSKLAEKEMIEQTIKLREAKLRNLLASDQQVNEAFANFAKQNRMSASRLSGELRKAGIGDTHFKDFIRTQMSWQRVIRSKYNAESTRGDEGQIVAQLRRDGKEKPEVTEYNLQQIVFVVPKAKRSNARLNARRKEANAFRQRFTKCEDTITQAKALLNVSVLDKKRIMEPELPANWKDELVNVEENKTTRVKETEKGVEIIAVCNRRIVSDDRAAQVSSAAESFQGLNKGTSKVSNEYLEELMKQSTIVYL